MTIDKRPSGSYRIRQMIDGKVYSVTVDHKPNQTEAALLIAELIKNEPCLTLDGTVGQCVNGYLKAKSNVLSPSTIRGYRGMARQVSPEFNAISMNKLTLPILQNEVNRYAKDHASKSVANFSGFLTAVCRFVGLDIKSPTLPTKERNSGYIPTKNDVIRICEHIKGTIYEVPILLSMYGLRRSEICALTLADLSGNVITIDKALVQNEQNKWIIKTTKTEDSTRTVVIDDYLVYLIQEQGYVYEGYPNQILKAIQKAQKDLGIEKFPLHKMRHFYASYLHDLGYSDKQIQDAGGWKTDIVMKNIYQHSMDMNKAKTKIAHDISGLIQD